MATGGRKYPGDETGPALSWISRRMPSRFIQYVSTLRETIFGYHYCFARCRSSLSDPLVWSKTSSAEQSMQGGSHVHMEYTSSGVQ